MTGSEIFNTIVGMTIFILFIVGCVLIILSVPDTSKELDRLHNEDIKDTMERIDKSMRGF